MDESITGFTACPGGAAPVANCATVRVQADHALCPDRMVVASIRLCGAARYVFVTCAAWRNRGDDLDHALHRQLSSNRSIIWPQTSNWSSAMYSSGLCP
jgi:hypothetical protein